MPKGVHPGCRSTPKPPCTGDIAPQGWPQGHPGRPAHEGHPNHSISSFRTLSGRITPQIVRFCDFKSTDTLPRQSQQTSLNRNLAQRPERPSHGDSPSTAPPNSHVPAQRPRRPPHVSGRPTARKQKTPPPGSSGRRRLHAAGRVPPSLPYAKAFSRWAMMSSDS